MKGSRKSGRTETSWLSFLTAFIIAGLVLCPQVIAQEGIDRLDISDSTLQETMRLGHEGGAIYLHLASGTFDPVTGPLTVANLPQVTMESIPLTESVYYLVQMKGPITDEHKERLTAAGAKLFDYIPEFAFIVKMSGGARAIIETFDFVRWVGIYQPGYRVEPKLLNKLSLSVPSKPMELIVVTFADEDVDLIADQLEAMGAKILDVTSTKWKGKIKVEIDSSMIPQMSELIGVRWIEEEPVWELHNDVSRQIMNVGPVWSPHNLQGEGQVVAVADTGLDRGSTNPANLHDDFEDEAGNTRVIQIFDRVGDGAGDVYSGHGTHVAGSVLGNGARSGDTYAGVARKAQLIFQAVENNTTGALTGIPTDLNVLFDQARTAGAHIHTNSWGASLSGAYNSRSEDLDENAWDNKNFVILFSAGNSGVDSNADGIIDLNSMGSPATAKNCITVGATENNRPSGSIPTPGYDIPWATGSWAVKYPSNPIASDHVSNNPEGMAAFSSRGPCLDGRTKPDLVAPGTNVVSTLSSLVSPPALWGEGGLIGGLEDFYVFSGGTSMSTPLVAGAAALVREFYTDQGVSPSSALIKAALINGARDLSGQYAGSELVDSPRPNQDEGWGRVDLQNSLFPEPPGQMAYKDIDPGLMTNEADTFTVSVADNSRPLRISLVWTDYPGSTVAGGGLVNDLDLSVIDPLGTTHYPNGASQRGITEVLSYDDGVYNGYSWGTGVGYAVRFTPTSYPVKLDKALFNQSLRSGYGYPRNFTVNVWDDDGSGGSPGTKLGSVSSGIRSTGWHVVDLSNNNITIADGDFYVEMRPSDAYLVLFSDNDPPIDGRSWLSIGTSWSQPTGLDYMIRATVASPDHVTSYDRVNNVEGVDIETPLPGLHTINVQGFNVPQGPQPYALVISGGIATVDFVTNTDSVTVPEGGTATFQVKLSAQPTTTVNASVAWFSGDTDITVQSGSSLIFTPSNWDTYQTVTLRAAEDVDVGNGTATIRISSSGVPTKDVTAAETDNDVLSFITSTDSVAVPEGGTATFQVKLSAQPTTTVNASVAWFSGDTDITVQSGSSLTFTPSNWDTYQTVTLRAAEDVDVDNGAATIRISASGVPTTKDVIATETDNDVLSFITSTDSVAVPEGGTTTFQVKLSAQPTTTVNASVAWFSGDTDITVQSGSSLTFTPSNWDTYQTVTLRAAEDVDVGNGTATIRISSSGVPTTKDITATEADNDVLSFVTNTDSVTVLEGGTATFQVKLGAQPTSTVNAFVAWFSGDTDITVQSGSSLIFTPSNWSTYQTVTLRAAEDGDLDNGIATIRISASEVPGYKDVTATEIDNDIVNFVTNTDLVTVPEGGTATFKVKLSARPSSTVNASLTLLAGGDADIRIKSGASLRFTTANWNIYQKVVLSDAEDPDLLNGTATIRISGPGVQTDKDVIATEADNDMSLLTPGDGEIIPSGALYPVSWMAPPQAVKFKLAYSMDNGTIWMPINNNDFVPGPSYNWTVPTPMGNKKKCLVKLVGYDAFNRKVGSDKSDAPFAIEVINLTYPNLTETFVSGSKVMITWTTNSTKKPVAKTILYYTKDACMTWSRIKLFNGDPNPRSHEWTVPLVGKAKPNCKVKVVLKDSNGSNLGSDVSDAYFTISPP